MHLQIKTAWRVDTRLNAQGDLRVLDVRVNGGVVNSTDEATANLHTRKINSIDFQGRPNSGSNTFATSCTDSTVCMWDLRQLSSNPKKAELACLGHNKACHSTF
jgi:WD40 repeat protein